jgi:hypothetical protein
MGTVGGISVMLIKPKLKLGVQDTLRDTGRFKLPIHYCRYTTAGADGPMWALYSASRVEGSNEMWGPESGQWGEPRCNTKRARRVALNVNFFVAQVVVTVLFCGCSPLLFLSLNLTLSSSSCKPTTTPRCRYPKWLTSPSQSLRWV